MKYGRSRVVVSVQVMGEEDMAGEGSDVRIRFDAFRGVVVPTWGSWHSSRWGRRRRISPVEKLR